MIKEAYDKLKKEHPLLPDFDKLNKEFDIKTIDEDAFSLREIKKKIGETYEPLLELLEHLISPDPGSLSDMYECRAFTNGEKKQLIDVFRHMMEHYRMLLETDLIGEDKTDVETIKKTYDTWVSDKKQLVPFIKKLRESWQKHFEPKEILEYLG